MGSKGGSVARVPGLSSSATRRKNREEHLWPLENFSSQLKHKPFSRLRVISLGDRRCTTGGGDLVSFVGEGNKEVGEGGERGAVGKVRGRPMGG